MQKIVSLMLYVLWIATIVMVLAATFTNFAHVDLNLFAIGFFLFALLNSFLLYARNKVNERMDNEGT